MHLYRCPNDNDGTNIRREKVSLFNYFNQNLCSIIHLDTDLQLFKRHIQRVPTKRCPENNFSETTNSIYFLVLIG
jgi:hypothetical protein